MSEPTTGTIDPTTGGFTPEDVPRTGSELNPYVDSDPWGYASIGNFLLPGIITSIDGASKPEEWSVQKGTSSSNATTVWKGTKLAEKITITINLFDVHQIDGYYSLRDHLRPKLGTKPPSWEIVNAAINFARITRVAVVDVLPPKWLGSSNSWEGRIELIEYNPSKPAKAGPASAAKAGGGQGTAANAPPTANQQAAQEFAAAIEQAKSI